LEHEKSHYPYHKFCKRKLEGAEAGHDWFHIERVWKLSKKIAKKKAEIRSNRTFGTFHDIADPKFHNGDETLAIKISLDFLKSIHVKKINNQVCLSLKIFL
jgi:uncharacterized protein